MLNEQEQADLEALTRHPGYKVLEKLESDLLIQYLSAFKDIDYSNSQSIDILKNLQIYSKAREDFLRDTKKHIQKYEKIVKGDFTSIASQYFAGQEEV